MTPEKQKQKLSGQSGIAQKAFQFVPIGEDWRPSRSPQRCTKRQAAALMRTPCEAAS